MKIGYFGKLPGYGDFIQRNVTPDIVKHWDNWIMKSIQASREQLADNWKAHYFNSPIWRFVIDHGALINSTVAGFMMPSVDKSGRCYPFTVICQAEHQVNPFIFARKTDEMHSNAEEFVLSLLEKRHPDLDEISTILNDIYVDGTESSYKSSLSVNSTSVMEIASISDVDLTDFANCNESFLETLINRQNIHISIWSMSGASVAKSRKRYFSGMPPVDNFYSFLMMAEN